MGRVALAVVGGIAAFAIAAALIGFAAGHYTNATTTVTRTGGSAPAASAGPSNLSPSVQAGAHDFVLFACSQCHGAQGRGGVSPAVPALTSAGKTLTVAQLRTIIDHGLGASANPKQPYMPVWGEVMSNTQVTDLVAYIRAGLPNDPNAQPVHVPYDEAPAVAGAALYQRYGCINCHGPSGLGGIPNPLSHDKVIPPLSGGGFHHDFPTDKAIADVIRSGSVIGKAPIVSMPHWGGILTDAQIADLIAYLKTLK
ncbi:MAG: c-type cytochrome [Actinobacteria bacterium]|nr:c-type cytochrome [Actinomycetota bacterium]MBV8563325.1 c-type cytochrome [Actinomycetota bacterium]